ncbi:MAG: T9SS type A sorting domain-containing protein [Flavobacteriales bacterium]|nr:T9SS type A sorting domain-containing protein [Flavobacteriales bacterium]
MTHAEIGEMWNFDGVQNAQVTSISTQDIFSTVDSVKNITVDDGQEFLLSKEHGLLRYYNPNEEEELFELIGIQGRDVGLLVPELEEIFDHQVGDVIQYKYKIYSEGNAQQVDGIIKRTILEVESTPEEITLHYDEVSQHTYGHWGPPDQSYPPTTYYHAFTANETFTLEDYLFLEEDVHEHSKANFGVYADSIPLPEGDVSDYIVTLTSENDRMIKKYGIHIGMDTESLQSLEGQELGSILLAIEEYSPVIFREELYSNMFEDTPLFWFAADHNVYRENLGMSFTEGLGMTSYLWAGGIGSSMGLWMTGYVHQGDTTGVIDSDSYILTSDEYGIEESITVFPNPANDMLYLHWPGDELLEEVEILDNLGRVIDQPKQNGSAQGRNSIDISSFPSGLYLLLLRTDNSEYIGKFIKE